MERLDKALMADSSSIFVGSLLGTRAPPRILESALRRRGGRPHGLTAATVAVLFLACLFFAPLAGSVPAYATAPALFYVACLMLHELVDLDWDDLTEVLPPASRRS